MDAAKLDYQYRTLSFESGVMSVREISDELRKHLVGYITDAKSFIHELMSPTNLHKSDFVPDRKVDGVLKAISYLSIEQVTVFVPSGMDVKMLEFIDALAASQAITDRLINDGLKPALVYFSQLLSSPETLSSVIGPGARGNIIFHTKEIEAAKTKMSGCFSGSTADSQRSFGKIYDRNTDYLTASKQLQEICERQAKNAPGEIMHHLRDLTEVMDRLSMRMTEHPDVYKVTGVTSKQLADTTDALAREVSFYAATSFHIQTAVTAMRDSNVKLAGLI